MVVIAMIGEISLTGVYRSQKLKDVGIGVVEILVRIGVK